MQIKHSNMEPTGNSSGAVSRDTASRDMVSRGAVASDSISRGAVSRSGSQSDIGTINGAFGKESFPPAIVTANTFAPENVAGEKAEVELEKTPVNPQLIRQIRRRIAAGESLRRALPQTAAKNSITHHTSAQNYAENTANYPANEYTDYLDYAAAADSATAAEKVAAHFEPLIYTSQLAALKTSVAQIIFGAGQTLTPLLEDPTVTDVLVNGTAGIWVDRGAGLLQIPDAQVESELKTDAGVRALAVRLAASCGQRLDDAAPIVDGTFASGVRLHAVLPPLCAEGTLISLRTHRRKSLTFTQLIENGAIHPDFAEILRAFIAKKANVIISGATGAGKTTFLNAMLQLVPETERILVIEESAELRPAHPHVVHLQVRRANVQGVGEITMSELVRAAMRMRPDRIVLGECRGTEVRDVLSALNTGHEGGWATIHANSAQDVPARLTALGALAQLNPAAVAAQASSALDAVIHLRRKGALRYVSEIGVLEQKNGQLHCENAWRLVAQDAPAMPRMTQSPSISQFRVVAAAGAAKLQQRFGVKNC